MSAPLFSQLFLYPFIIFRFTSINVFFSAAPFPCLFFSYHSLILICIAFLLSALRQSLSYSQLYTFTYLILTLSLSLSFSQLYLCLCLFHSFISVSAFFTHSFISVPVVFSAFSLALSYYQFYLKKMNMIVQNELPGFILAVSLLLLLSSQLL